MTAAGSLAAVARLAARSILAAVGCLVVLSLVPLAFDWRPYVVMSGSMSPNIRTGDLVVAAPVASSLIRPGHVVVFTDPSQTDRLLVHRVVRPHTDGSFITRGDANGSEDSTPVPSALIKGMARLRIPVVGLPAYWAGTGQWQPLGATGGVLLVLLMVAGRQPRPDPVSPSAAEARPTLEMEYR